MVFSSSSDKSGIIEEIDFWILGSSASSSIDYVIADKTRNINRWLDRVVSLILQADNRWEWDDTNHTDLPIATTTLVHNQQDYEITGAAFLKIIRVEVKNSSGDFKQLTPISQQDKRGIALSEYQKTAGMPKEYDKLGNSIFLYPKPSSSNVTLSAGLKIYFQRTVDYFTTSDATQEPGFASPYHRILSVGAAKDYCVANTLQSRIAILDAEIAKLEAGILEFYSSRDRDDRPRLGLKREDYGADQLLYGGLDLEMVNVQFQ